MHCFNFRHVPVSEALLCFYVEMSSIAWLEHHLCSQTDFRSDCSVEYYLLARLNHVLPTDITNVSHSAIIRWHILTPVGIIRAWYSFLCSYGKARFSTCMHLCAEKSKVRVRDGRHWTGYNKEVGWTAESMQEKGKVRLYHFYLTGLWVSLALQEGEGKINDTHAHSFIYAGIP